jgi:hypothetical protein
LLPLNDGDDQQFEANFRDGAHLLIFVDPSNPQEFFASSGRTRIVHNDRWLRNFVDRYTMDDPSDVAGA